MRVLCKVHIPAEAGNKAVIDGTLGKTVGEFCAKFKPEVRRTVQTSGRKVKRISAAIELDIAPF